MTGPLGARAGRKVSVLVDKELTEPTKEADETAAAADVEGGGDGSGEGGEGRCVYLPEWAGRRVFCGAGEEGLCFDVALGELAALEGVQLANIHS